MEWQRQVIYMEQESGGAHLKKYHKVTKEDYERWYLENQDYRDQVKSDPNRLVYHLMPETGWLNDPNGLCQFGGLYHIYYQYTPFEPTGEIKLWGHYTTKDFVHYTNEEPMLFPDCDFDAHGVYSGSAFVEDGVIHYFYTGNVKRFDRDDYDYIMTGRESNTVYFNSRNGYECSQKELLLTNQDYPSDMSCHIRDPKIYKQDGRYYMVLGARDKQSRGLVLMYQSEDLKHWNYCGRITTEESFGYMWECPDLFRLDGQLCLICCPQGVKPQGVDYQNVHQCTFMPLDYDFEHGTYTIDHPEKTSMVDRGFDFYAPQTFVDEKDRRIMIGWMGIPDADYTNPTAESGWQHALTIPRVLHIKDGRLIQTPIEELRQLRRGGRSYTMEELGRAGESGIVFEACFHFDSCVRMRMTLRPGVTLTYKDGLLTLDMGDKGSGRTNRSVMLDGLRQLQVFSDTSSLELFVNEGREVFTTRVYGLEGGLTVEGDCTGTVQVYDLSGFIMEGIV